VGEIEDGGKKGGIVMIKRTVCGGNGKRTSSLGTMSEGLLLVPKVLYQKCLLETGLFF